jgi:phosphomannomutase
MGKFHIIRRISNFTTASKSKDAMLIFALVESQTSMTPIKFGTDGWRAIIAKDFTVDNVARVSQAVATWILNHKTSKPTIVLGYDCRFGGELFAETAALIFGQNGIKVFMSKGFVSTPMISLGAHILKTDLGVIITASHNPPSYNGYKLKANHGGPASPAVIAQVEQLIHDEIPAINVSLKALESKGLLEYVDFELMYLQHVRQHFDLKAINDSGLVVAFDAMYGAGQRVVGQLLENVVPLHCEYNPGFNGTAPEPLPRNLSELETLIKNSTDIDVGLAVDGDADRIGMYDAQGNFIDAHHLLLLLIHYLHQYKQYRGKVVVAFSVSPKIKKLCDAYNIETQITRIGFKYISEIMVTDNVLVGGEESGGIALKGHIPERDGIWDGLTILEFMAKTGKSVNELIQEVYKVVGPFAYDRNDLHLSEQKKQEILTLCNNGHFKSFGPYTVEKVETLDGFKYYLPHEATLMIRASGTEPVLRIYAEAANHAEVQNILKAAKDTLLK